MSELIKKTHQADLRKKSGSIMDYSILSALTIVIVAFGTNSTPFEENTILDSVSDEVTLVPVDPTRQMTKPPEPTRPQIPIEAEDEDEVDDVTIDDTDVDILETYSDIENFEDDPEPLEYFSVSVKPTIKFQVTPVYSDIARRAGIEARVTVQLIIDKNGLPTDVKILKGHPMLNDDAIAAAKKYRFNPGMQGDKAVPVKWNIPFNFRLRN